MLSSVFFVVVSFLIIFFNEFCDIVSTDLVFFIIINTILLFLYVHLLELLLLSDLFLALISQKVDPEQDLQRLV